MLILHAVDPPPSLTSHKGLYFLPPLAPLCPFTSSVLHPTQFSILPPSLFENTPHNVSFYSLVSSSIQPSAPLHESNLVLTWYFYTKKTAVIESHPWVEANQSTSTCFTVAATNMMRTHLDTYSSCTLPTRDDVVKLSSFER